MGRRSLSKKGVTDRRNTMQYATEDELKRFSETMVDEPADDGMEFLFEGITWTTRNDVGLKRSLSGHDISIVKTKRGFNITFRNGLRDTLPDRLAIAIKGDTLMFKTNDDGWTVSKLSSKKNCYITLNTPKPDLTDFIGDYDVEYFEPLDIWYIRKEVERC